MKSQSLCCKTTQRAKERHKGIIGGWAGGWGDGCWGGVGLGGCSHLTLCITFRHSSRRHLREPKEKWLPRVLFFPDTSVAGSRVWPHYGSICECHWSGPSYLRLFQVLPLGKKKRKKKRGRGRGRQTRTLLAERSHRTAVRQDAPRRRRRRAQKTRDYLAKTSKLARQCEAALTSSARRGPPCKINRGHSRAPLLSPPVRRKKKKRKKKTPSETLRHFQGPCVYVKRTVDCSSWEVGDWGRGVWW